MPKTPNYNWPLTSESEELTTIVEEWTRRLTGDSEDSILMQIDANMAKLQSKLIGENITVVAQDKIKIGNIVYTVKGGLSASGVPVHIDGISTFSGSVTAAAISPDKTLLVLGGTFQGRIKIYSINGKELVYISDLYADSGNTPLTYGEVFTITFSSDGTLLVIGGNFKNAGGLYSVSGQSVTFLQNIPAGSDGKTITGAIRSAVFTQNDSRLILVGDFSYRASLYEVNESSVVWKKRIYADNNSAEFSLSLYTATVSSDGKMLVIGGSFKGYAKLYSINGDIITFIKDIEIEYPSSWANKIVWRAAFSPTEPLLLLGGDIPGYAQLYEVSDGDVSFVSKIYADNETTELNGNTFSIGFSSDGRKLILGGLGYNGYGYAKFYTVNGKTITYETDFYSGEENARFSGKVLTSTLSSDESLLIIGGGFNGGAFSYYPTAYAHTALNFKPVGTYQIGISNEDIEAGKTGAVNIITGHGFRPDTWMPTAEEIGADPAGSSAQAAREAMSYADNLIVNISYSDKMPVARKGGDIWNQILN